MTRFAVDPEIALRLIRESRTVAPSHSLVAPSSLRSEVLSRLYRDVRTGDLDAAEGKRQLEGLAGLKIRLLADRVSRATAWKIATALDWDEIGAAEYLAVARLQADALVTEDAELQLASAGLVPVGRYDELFTD